MRNRDRVTAAEAVTFVVAALCVVLGVVVTPRTGGVTWVVLGVAALLVWQGLTLRRRRRWAAPHPTG